MKTLTRFVRTTVLGGLFFLIPIVVLGIVIAKALEYTNKFLRILTSQILAASELSATGATVMSIVVVALACFFAGLLARTVTAQKLVKVLEDSILSHIPGYEYLKQEGASALGLTEIGELPVVFVPMEGGWQLGVQTDTLSNGLVSIFVPGAPNPHSGAVFFFSADTVRPAGIKLIGGLNCLKRCGGKASALDAIWPAAA
jgi:uncharacterized membrane protein